MKTLSTRFNDRIYDRMMREEGAAGYMFLWLMGVPASVLFVIFLLRGCN
jgi:hypothetical protein